MFHLAGAMETVANLTTPALIRKPDLCAFWWLKNQCNTYYKILGEISKALTLMVSVSNVSGMITLFTARLLLKNQMQGMPGEKSGIM